MYDYASLGYLYHTVGMPHEAVTAYSKAEKLGFKEKGWLYSGTSGCYLSLQEYNRAIEFAKKDLSLNPGDNYAKEVLLASMEEEGAGPILDRLVEEYHDTSLAHILLAQEALGHNDLSKAHEMITKAAKTDPSPVEIYGIARMYAKLGDWKASLQACLDSERLGYENRYALYALMAWNYCGLEDYDSAFQLAMKVLSIAPDDEYTRELLYECREALWGTDFGDNY